MTELQRLLYRELYKKSFYEFVKGFWNEVDPAKFVDGKIIQFYCETFQYMCKQWVPYEEIPFTIPKFKSDTVVIDVRSSNHNININVPPRHTKSVIFNIMGPVWLWTHYPVKAVSISHTEGLAGRMNTGRKKIVNSDKFKVLFPEISLVANSNTFISDNRGGELYSLNRNAMTGYGGDIIINDDLTNAEAARKDREEMANAWAYYQNTLPSRINDINRCIIMNIQQRLAPNDITGHILSDSALQKRYTFVVLPAIFDKQTVLVCPISGELVKFNVGDSLWPERFGNYDAIRAEVGETIFQTQYLQKPISSDRTVIKESMIIEKDETDVPSVDQADMIYAGHDFPVKDKETSDYLGSVLAYRVNSTLYIKDCLEKRMSFVKSVEYVRQLDQVYPGIIQVIEDKANGSPILQQLQDEVAGMQAYQPGTASKTQRLESASLYMISGNVVFVRSKFDVLTQTYSLTEPLQNLKQRLLSFPFVEHDDIVDAFDMIVLFVFMDRRYMVYGRSFNDQNILAEKPSHAEYSNIFFNKEGDVWRAVEISVAYGEHTKIHVDREIRFKGAVEQGLKQLRQFAPEKTMFIDCSATPALEGMSSKSTIVERYAIEDFDKSVAQLNLAFDKKLALISKNCVLTKSDIENFKFTKQKDDTVKYTSTKDGFVACIRTALRYYGGIV